MGLFDRLRGAGEQRTYGTASDEQAIARYRYLLKTAPPETIEQAHAEAFAQLTPAQRRLLLEQFGAEVPPAERAAAARAGDDPQALARLATRAEVRQPGAIERVMGRAGGLGFGGLGFGGLVASSLLGSLAGTVLGSMIAQNFLADHGAADAGPGAEGAAGDDSFTHAVDDAGGGLDSGDVWDV